ncbi:PGPGW domain-containing protein [Okibacterium endophyticum]
MDAANGTAGGRSDGRSSGVFHKTRRVIRRHPRVNRAYRTSVGVTGATTVALGIVLMPLPGPGSLIALGGLAILGTEFEGAKKVSTRANAAVRTGLAKAKEHRRQKKERSAERDARDPAHTGR